MQLKNTFELLVKIFNRVYVLISTTKFSASAGRIGRWRIGSELADNFSLVLRKCGLIGIKSYFYFLNKSFISSSRFFSFFAPARWDAFTLSSYGWIVAHAQWPKKFVVIYICVDMLIRRKQLLLDHQLAYTEMDSAEADGADILVNWSVNPI